MTTAVREERKVLTAVFADVVGSTALAERLDPEDVKLVVGEAVARIVSEVESLGGHVKDLAGDGVLEDRRVQRPTLPPRQRPRLRDDLGHGFEDTVRPLARGEAFAPINQHRRMKRRLRQREPARCFPAQIKGDRLRCFPVGEVVQRLQHNDRRDHISRRRRAAKLGREQVLERVVREQIVPVLGEERIHRPDREKVPRQHLNIVNLTLTIIMTLHNPSLNQPREST